MRWRCWPSQSFKRRLAWGSVGAICVAAAGHGLAARANHTGRIPRLLRPVLHLYLTLDRWMRR